VSVGIVEVKLLKPVRTFLRRRRDADSMSGDYVESFGNVVDGEGNVVTSRSDAAAGGPTGRSCFGALLCCVNLDPAELEPEAWEFESGAFDFQHAEEIDVEAPGGHEVAADQCDVIERSGINSMGLRHGRLFYGRRVQWQWRRVRSDSSKGELDCMPL
jgi:hypothetical protein